MTERKTYQKRNREIRKLYNLGLRKWTLQAIADKYGLTKGRVHQIVRSLDKSKA
jgi:hypothetical protein